ncbi:hypothetical protein [Streptomyces sp. NPDC054794]
MADEQYKWLDRETAERLLRGESLEAVDASAREQAERLAKALGALSVDAPAAGELPGEEGALAAFRKAREASEAERVAAGHRDELAARRAGRTEPSSDVGLVRIGGRSRPDRRRNRARPVRLALAAALAAGMLGGVAVAAGTGVLPTPFQNDRPGPAASVSAPEQPLVSPSQGSVQGGESGTPTPGGTASATPGTGSRRDTAGQDPATGEPTGSAGASRGADEWWSGALSACRDIRDGRNLDADRKRALEGAAGGAARVWRYCRGVLDGHIPGRIGGDDADERGGKGDGDDKNGQGGDDDRHRGRHHRDREHGNDHHQDGGAVTPAPTVFGPLPVHRPTRTQAPAPSPTYSAL